MQANEVLLSTRPGRRARTAQACQHCRALKARCLSGEQPGICQRCQTSKRECVWPENQPRAKRVRTSGTSRLSQMEHKIDGLVALLAEPETAKRSPLVDPSPSQNIMHPSMSGSQYHSPLRLASRPSSTPRKHGPRDGEPTAADPGSLSPPADQPTTHLDQHREPTNSIRPHEVHQHEAFSESFTTTEPAHSQEKIPGPSNDFINGLVTASQTESLFNDFRAMTDFFPFVAISPTSTAQQLQKEKPILLLAILTTAASGNRLLQVTLEEQYRQELARRTIIRPQRSLSLIQSMLVYLSWYHFHFTPQTQQMYPLLQLAIGIAIDLGYCQKSRKPLIDISGRAKSPVVTAGEEREVQRAVLGCYVLSSAFSSALSRQNAFRHTDYMTECGNRLEVDLEYSSDGVLLQLVNLRRIDDQIYDTFRSTDTHELVANDARSQMHLQLVQSQLKEIKMQPSNSAHQCVIDLSRDFINMELHSIGLRIKPSSNGNISNNNVHQINILLSCLEGAKAFLDRLMALPPSQYPLLSFVEWIRLPYVLIIISKLSFPSPVHDASHWDVRIAQDKVRLDLYLESLCYRMQSLSTYSRSSQPHPDFWLSLKMIMEKTRNWYVKQTKGTEVATEDSPLEHIQNPHDDVRHVHTDTDTTTANATQREHSNEGHGQQKPIDEGTVSGIGVEGVPTIPDFYDMEEFLATGIWGSSCSDASTFQDWGDMGL